jgi:hypothetical protein
MVHSSQTPEIAANRTAPHLEFLKINQKKTRR